MPTFTAPLDCTPWVVGGLWPTELSPADIETAALAEYLKVDLQRIANSANEDLKAIARAGMVHPARRDAEARVIDEARALAERRVESTVRQLRQMRRHTPGLRSDNMDKTQVMPALREASPPPAGTPSDVPEDPVETADDDQRLHRLLAFAAREEPRLSWAIGEATDGTTVLVTDLAHGWIPPGIAVPEGVRLLEPRRRSGRVSDLLGDTTRTVTYAPGDSANWMPDSPGTTSSTAPLQLPAVDDLGWKLGVATHRREGLPRLVNTLVKAAAGGADVVEQEADLLRVHLDTARYQLLAQYPDPDLSHLLNCMLLAATESLVSGDSTSANYHFAWFEELDAELAGRPGETSQDSTA